MATQVTTARNDTLATHCESYGLDALPMSNSMRDHDLAHGNKNAHHREAIRLALGSILTPKRHTPSQSRSSSGSATPVHPFHFPAGASGTSPPPSTPTSNALHSPSTQIYNHGNIPRFPDSHLQIPHTHSPSHPPSRLSISRVNSDQSVIPASGGQTSPLTTSSSHDNIVSVSSSHPSDVHVHKHDLVAPAPIRVVAAPNDHAIHTRESRENGGSGSGTPKAKFIETLQSKKAWDALIHGSFA